MELKNKYYKIILLIFLFKLLINRIVLLLVEILGIFIRLVAVVVVVVVVFGIVKGFRVFGIVVIGSFNFKIKYILRNIYKSFIKINLSTIVIWFWVDRFKWFLKVNFYNI